MSDKKCGPLILTESVNLNADIPIDSPINGNQKIRNDIEVKEGIVNYSIVKSEKGSFPSENSSILNKIFDERLEGVFLKISSTKSREGGESSNPMFLLSENYIGG